MRQTLLIVSVAAWRCRLQRIDLITHTHPSAATAVGTTSSRTPHIIDCSSRGRIA